MLLSLFTSSVFLNVTAPGGSLGGMLYQVQRVVKETKSDSGRVFVALSMVILNMYWAFLTLAIVSLWFVFSHGMESSPAQLVGFLNFNALFCHDGLVL